MAKKLLTVDERACSIIVAVENSFGAAGAACAERLEEGRIRIGSLQVSPSGKECPVAKGECASVHGLPAAANRSAFRTQIPGPATWRPR